MAKSPPPSEHRPSTQSVQRLLKLLAIPGESGKEREVRNFVRAELLRAGASETMLDEDHAHQRSPLSGEVGNLVLKLPGTMRGPRRLLSAHLDTVPICVGSQPRRRGQVVDSSDPHTGLGADNRAGCAVLLETAAYLLQHPDLPRPPLTFLWTVQEEVGLHGARLLQLEMLGKPKFGFNWDGGSASKLTIGATGGYRLTIEIHGKASHAGGAPEKGISAIAVAAIAIAQLHQSGWHGAIHQNGRSGTSNVGVIEGGKATNVVTDRVSVRAEARSHDPEFREAIVNQIRQAFEQAAALVSNIDGETAQVLIDGRLDYESFCLPTDHPAIAIAVDAVEQTGRESEIVIANGGLDANWLTARGIPTVSLGCGQRNQHTVDEQLDLDEFAIACDIARKIAAG